jgi:outer membrane translocation and assembly module TamA
MNRTKPSSQDPKWGEEVRLSLRNAAAPLLSQSDESAAVLSATVYHKTGFGSDMVIGRVSLALLLTEYRICFAIASQS